MSAILVGQRKIPAAEAAGISFRVRNILRSYETLSDPAGTDGDEEKQVEIGHTVPARAMAFSASISPSSPLSERYAPFSSLKASITHAAFSAAI